MLGAGSAPRLKKRKLEALRLLPHYHREVDVMCINPFAARRKPPCGFGRN